MNDERVKGFSSLAQLLKWDPFRFESSIKRSPGARGHNSVTQSFKHTAVSAALSAQAHWNANKISNWVNLHFSFSLERVGLIQTGLIFNFLKIQIEAH